MTRAILAAILLATSQVQAEDNLIDVSVNQAQAVAYSIRTTHTGTSDRHQDTLRTTNGRLDYSLTPSGVDKDDAPWSTTATADLDSDYTLDQDGQTLSFSGTASTLLTFAQENPAPNIEDSWHSTHPWNYPPVAFLEGNKIALTFTVDKYWVDYALDCQIIRSTYAETRFYLLKQTYSSELNGYIFGDYGGPPAIDENLSSSGTLEEGVYQLLIVIRGEKNCDAAVSFSLDLTPDPDDPLITNPPPGGYTHPKIGTLYTDSEKLTVRNPAIASETDLGDGTTKLEVTAELENTSARKWSSLNLELAFRKDDAPDLISATPVTYVELEPDITAPFPDGEKLEVVVTNENLDTVKASILDGSRFTTYGRELWSYSHPPIPYDFHESHSGGVDTLLYEGMPPVSRGQLIVVVPDLYPIPPEKLPTSQIPPLSVQSVDRKMPFLVSGITEPSDASLSNTYQINGEQVTVLDYMIEGTQLTTLPRIYPGTGTNIEKTGYYGNQDSTYFAHPIHFNRIPFSDTFELSGSFAIKPDDFRVEIDMAAGILKSLYAEGKMSAECNFLLEASVATDNSESSAQDRTKTIADFPLFTLVLPGGITFTPEFKLDLSATVDAGAGISVPITTSMEVVFRGGYVDGAAAYDCDVTPIPQRLSPPTIFSAANASLEVEADAQMAFMFHIPETPVSIGPTFGAALIADFSLDALADPAWNIGADLELRGGMEFDLAGYFNLVDVEHPLFTTPIFQSDSGAPLGGGPSLLAEDGTHPLNPGLKPIEGESTRWIRAHQPFNNTSTTAAMWVVPLAGRDRIVAGASHVTNGEIACYDAEGGLLWLLNTTFLRPIDAVAAPDGTVTVLSNATNKIQLTNFDADGNTVWSKAYSISDGDNIYGFENAALAYGLDPQGDPQYVVLSRGGDRSPPFYRIPALFKFDGDGEPVWQKAYLPDENDEGGTTSCELSDVIVTRDGNIAYVGTTGANVKGSIDGGLKDASPNHTYNGLAAKVSSGTGEPIWGTVLASTRIPTYTSIAEDPDGNLYLGGGILLVVTDSTPSLLLSKLNPDGAIVDSVLIGAQAPDLGITDNSHLNQNVPNGGQTLFDTIRDLVWVDDALWFGGKMGFYNSGVSYLTGSHAFTGRATPQLGVNRFAIHAGPAGDDISALADGGDGLLAYGTSASFLPWPYGGASEAEFGDVHRILMKLPWEGLARFHTQSAGAHPELTEDPPVQGTYYVYPQVVAATDTKSFSVSQDSPTPKEDEVRTAASSLGFTVIDLAVNEGSLALAPTLATPLAYHALEYIPNDALKSRTDLLASLQLDPNADTDGDAWSNALEIFFGTDPLTIDSPRIQSTATFSTETPLLKITLPRADIADDQTPLLETSSNLIDWIPFDAFTLTEENLTATQDLLHLELPLPETATFYRFDVP